MNKRIIKRKASIALTEIIKAARKYIEAESELEKAILEERKFQKAGDLHEQQHD